MLYVRDFQLFGTSDHINDCLVFCLSANKIFDHKIFIIDIILGHAWLADDRLEIPALHLASTWKIRLRINIQTFVAVFIHTQQKIQRGRNIFLDFYIFRAPDR